MNKLKIIRSATLGLIGLFFLWFAANKESLRNQDIIDLGFLTLSQDILMIALGTSLIAGLALCASFIIEDLLSQKQDNKAQ